MKKKTRPKQKQYTWRGKNFPREKAEPVGRALEALRKKHGTVKPAEVVEAARPKSSPMHFAFTWDDTAAAEKCRLQEARDLTNSLRITFVGDDGTEREAPAFVNLTVTTEGAEPGTTDSDRGYHGIVSAMETPSLRAILLEQAKADLAAFRRRYAMLTELAEVFAALDRLDQAA